jgi:ABC-type Na+ transport system ATPase subunit NatA
MMTDRPVILGGGACGLILPTAGTIRINGYDVGRQRAGAVRQIGAVLEGSRNVYWPLTAWQNLMYFGRLTDFLGKLRARDIPLLSVTQAQPDLEEIFLRLIGQGTPDGTATRAAADREPVA